MIDSTRHATAFSFIPFVRMMFESSSYALRRDETPASSSLSSKNSSIASSLGASTSWLAVFSRMGMIMSKYGMKSSFSAVHMRPHAYASHRSRTPTVIMYTFMSLPSCSTCPMPSWYITSSTSRASLRKVAPPTAMPTHVMHSSALAR